MCPVAAIGIRIVDVGQKNRLPPTRLIVPDPLIVQGMPAHLLVDATSATAWIRLPQSHHRAVAPPFFIVYVVRCHVFVVYTFSQRTRTLKMTEVLLLACPCLPVASTLHDALPRGPTCCPCAQKNMSTPFSFLSLLPS